MKGQLILGCIFTSWLLVLFIFWCLLFIIRHGHRHHDVLGNAQAYRNEDTAEACALRHGRPYFDEDMQPPVYIVCQ